MISNVTVEKLQEKFGKDDGFRRFAEIAKLGGFGIVTRDHTGGVDPNYKGGLDLKGLGAAEGEHKLKDGVLAQIQELAGAAPVVTETSDSANAETATDAATTGEADAQRDPAAKDTTKGKENK